MLDLKLFAVVTLALIVTGLLGLLRARIERHGLLALTFRHLTGHPWHGKGLTDAGWLRPGTRALTRTGHAPRFHYRPRLHRTAIRTGTWTVVLLLTWGLLMHRSLTVWTLLGLTVAGVVAGVLLAVSMVRTRKHRREWVEPLHATLAPVVGVPLANKPSSWLEIERSHDKAVVTLPDGFHPTEHQRKEAEAVVRAKLGMESPDVTWRLTGPDHHVEFAAAAAPPPKRASLADIQSALDKAKPGQYVLGIGRGAGAVTVSHDHDSPHIGASMGSGGGKSTLGRSLLAQHLHNGGIGLVLDAKQQSHPWCWGLPNVAYADTPALIHDALVWLGDELARRNSVARHSTDVEGVMHGNPGASIMVLCEELNLTIPQLRDFWKDVLGGKGKSPAIQALEAIAYAGRQVRIHLVMIGQMLSARASGSGEARENIGIRILSRYTKRAWEMLAPEHPMPLGKDIDGRVQVVASGKVRETQIAIMTMREAREWAMSGIVTPLPAGMPGVTATPRLGPNAAGELTAAESRPVTLSEACAAGILPMSKSAARSARQRDENFPEPVGMRKAAHVYDAKALADYGRNR